MLHRVLYAFIAAYTFVMCQQKLLTYLLMFTIKDRANVYNKSKKSQHDWDIFKQTLVSHERLCMLYIHRGREIISIIIISIGTCRPFPTSRCEDLWLGEEWGKMCLLILTVLIWAAGPDFRKILRLSQDYPKFVLSLS